MAAAALPTGLGLIRVNRVLLARLLAIRLRTEINRDAPNLDQLMVEEQAESFEQSLFFGEFITGPLVAHCITPFDLILQHLPAWSIDAVKKCENIFRGDYNSRCFFHG